MTIEGALNDLNNLLKADDIPIYYKPSIKSVMETITMEKMPKVGHWEWNQYDANPKIGNFHCSLCHSIGRAYYDYCPGCGAKMSEIPTGAEGSEKND